MLTKGLSLVLAGFVFFGAHLTGEATLIHPAVTIPSSIGFTPKVVGLTAPVFMTGAGDGSNRLFIVQQTGQILIYKNGSLLSTPFLDILGLVSDFTGLHSEQGLLGLAFDPHYASNGYFYITYTTNNSDPTFIYTTTLARYHVSGGNPDLADSSSGAVLLSIPKKYGNHNGGMVAFGPDGYLYMSMGDGGFGGDPDNNAQNLHTLLGKLLRLDVDSTPPPGATYVIPPTNPFFGSGDPNVGKEIWAYGLRNPWRFSFNRLTGDLYIGDVGQNTEEEIDFQKNTSAGGQNYGWHVLEGNLCYDPSVNCGTPSGYVAPVTTYDHGTNDSYGCAITGGYVYEGNAFPPLKGVYFYGDFCSGKVLGLIRNPNNTWSSKLISSTSYLISSFGEDDAGELYLADYGAGTVYQISTGPAKFKSVGAHDGWILESAENSGVGGTLNDVAATFRLGDDALNRQYRGVLSFKTSSLPDNAQITRVTLKIRKQGLVGVDPFLILGNILVDIRKGAFSGNSALQTGDFQAIASKKAAASIINTPVSGWYSVDLGSDVFAYVNKTGITQFRLRFSSGDNDNGSADYLKFSSGNAGTASNRPKLVIEYSVP